MRRALGVALKKEDALVRHDLLTVVITISNDSGDTRSGDPPGRLGGNGPP